MLICCNSLLFGRSFRLYNHIAYICCFVATYLFLFWYGWFLWCFSCAAIRRDLVSLLMFPFLRHVHVFSCEMLLVSRLKRPCSCLSSYFCFLVISVQQISCCQYCFWWLWSVLFYQKFESLSSSRCLKWW